MCICARRVRDSEKEAMGGVMGTRERPPGCVMIMCVREISESWILERAEGDGGRMIGCLQ